MDKVSQGGVVADIQNTQQRDIGNTASMVAPTRFMFNGWLLSDGKPEIWVNGMPWSKLRITNGVRDVHWQAATACLGITLVDGQFRHLQAGQSLSSGKTTLGPCREANP